MAETFEDIEDRALNRFGAQEQCASQNDKGTLAPLTFEPDEYRGDLDGFTLTQEQQDEMLAALWGIVVSMVDIGFGLDSTQLVLDHFIDALDEISNAESHYGKTKICANFNQTCEQKGSNNDE